MPHLSLSQSDLDLQYPRIVAPEDDRLDDLATDECDTVCQKGLQIAEDIRESMRAHGRRKIPGIKPSRQEVNAVAQEEQVPEEATTDSASCRRRSVKTCKVSCEGLALSERPQKSLRCEAYRGPAVRLKSKDVSTEQQYKGSKRGIRASSLSACKSSSNFRFGLWPLYGPSARVILSKQF